MGGIISQYCAHDDQRISLENRTEIKGTIPYKLNVDILHTRRYITKQRKNVFQLTLTINLQKISKRESITIVRYIGYRWINLHLSTDQIDNNLEGLMSLCLNLKKHHNLKEFRFQFIGFHVTDEKITKVAKLLPRFKQLCILELKFYRSLITSKGLLLFLKNLGVCQNLKHLALTISDAKRYHIHTMELFTQATKYLFGSMLTLKFVQLHTFHPITKDIMQEFCRVLSKKKTSLINLSLTLGTGATRESSELKESNILLGDCLSELKQLKYLRLEFLQSWTLDEEDINLLIQNLKRIKNLSLLSLKFAPQSTLQGEAEFELLHRLIGSQLEALREVSLDFDTIQNVTPEALLVSFRSIFHLKNLAKFTLKISNKRHITSELLKRQLKLLNLCNFSGCLNLKYYGCLSLSAKEIHDLKKRSNCKDLNIEIMM